jgi:hypothetical protein
LTWSCPAWFPAGICANVVQVVEGTTAFFQPSLHLPFPVLEDLVVARTSSGRTALRVLGRSVCVPMVQDIRRSGGGESIAAAVQRHVGVTRLHGGRVTSSRRIGASFPTAPHASPAVALLCCPSRVTSAGPRIPPSPTMPKVGLEPTRSCPHRILSPARLPVPPLRRSAIVASDRAAQFERLERSVQTVHDGSSHT